MIAPIALFAYKRLEHIKLCIQSLLCNKEANDTDLIVFCDGPRGDDFDDVAKVRNYLLTVNGFKSINIINSSINLGLSNSIISGIDHVFSLFNCVIIIEDDLIVSPYFLEYMNYYLSKYEYSYDVASIHGYLYPISLKLTKPFFIKGADCWGWGTWKRAWTKFNPNGSELLSLLKSKGLTKDFNFNNSYPYSNMLQNQVLGKNNSWAIRWYASAYVNNMLTLYPNKSLVLNIGNDGTGAHCSENENFDVILCNEPIILDGLPVVESVDGRRAFQDFYQNIYGSRYNRLKRKISKYILGRVN